MPAYRCPACHSMLAEEPTGFACENRHRFDRAREGYVNLLPGGRLKGRPAGDSETMIRARRTVFDAGLYAPLIEAVAEQVAEHVTEHVAPRTAILDCGCGEGTYLASAARRSGAAGWGIDISKPAVRLAARRNPGLHFAVASSYALPFDDEAFHAVLSVFSPRPLEEMMRVLVPTGWAITAVPDADHLWQLKQLVYATPRPHEPTDEWPIRPDSGRDVRFDVSLERPELRTALLEMTPFWWSTSDDRRREITDSIELVTVAVRISAFRRHL